MNRERTTPIFWDQYPERVATAPPSSVIGRERMFQLCQRFEGGGESMLVVLELMNHYFRFTSHRWMMERRTSLPDLEEAFTELEKLFRTMIEIKELTLAGEYLPADDVTAGDSVPRQGR